MSMPIVSHVLHKSQTRSSARTLLLTLAVHANECCGVAGPGETTLTQEVNISLQRLHELKQALPTTGELVIVRRPGRRTLYFVAWHGRPLGPQGEYLVQKSGEHQPGCPLRHHPVDLPTDSPSPDPVDEPTGDPVGRPTPTPQASLRRQPGEREKNHGEAVSLSQEIAADAAEGERTAVPGVPSPTPRRIDLTPGTRAYRVLYGDAEAVREDTFHTHDRGLGIPSGTSGYPRQSHRGPAYVETLWRS